jgi:hypothetical protein
LAGRSTGRATGQARIVLLCHSERSRGISHSNISAPKDVSPALDMTKRGCPQSEINGARSLRTTRKPKPNWNQALSSSTQARSLDSTHHIPFFHRLGNGFGRRHAISHQLRSCRLKFVDIYASSEMRHAAKWCLKVSTPKATREQASTFDGERSTRPSSLSFWR